MTRNFTLYPAALCLLLLFVSPCLISQSVSQYNFSAIPTLVSGMPNQLNAVYRFDAVSPGVDAIVTIVSSTNGASVDIFDDNNITKPEGFSPKIRIPAHTTGFVEFSICFVSAGTMNTNIQDSLYATAIDIDGYAQVKELDIIDLGGGTSAYQFGTPEIIVTQSGTSFIGRNVAGNDYDGIDTAAKQVMFTVKNNNVSCFTYKCGAQNNSGVASRQKSIYFRNFTYPPAAPLPVKYTSFNAKVAEKGVNLEWITELEINHSHFEIERSFDHNSFKTIGIVLDGFQLQGSVKSYQYKDKSAELKGRTMVYYRLKQIDLDSRITYSVVLAVKLNEQAGMVMQVSPNPFAENLMLKFNSTENGLAEIRLVNMNGQQVLSKQCELTIGKNEIQVQGLARLTPGIYMAQILIDGVRYANQKLVKQ